MAGGVGSRFWPKSRNHFPKQFIDILGIGKSLLQLTYERFLKICPQENIFILANEVYAALIQEQLKGIDEANILLEPSRNNTAPCIAYAAYKIKKANPLANIVVAPSDHLILKEEEFLNKIGQALDYVASHEVLMTLGIQPTRPDTGYGYIKYQVSSTEYQVESTKYQDGGGVSKVTQFLEKPDLERAKLFVSSGDYLWNAGIFIWSAQAIVNAFKKYAPEIDTVFSKGESVYNTKGEAAFIGDHYSASPNISIDYAILEKADNVYTLPADIGWSDLGTWASLHAVAEKDEADNVVNAEKIYLNGVKDCIIHTPKRKAVVIKGLEDFIVVDDDEVLLIYPKKDEQEIKQVAGRIINQYGEDFG